MLNEFVEKILVHERDRKGSIQTTQEEELSTKTACLNELNTLLNMDKTENEIVDGERGDEEPQKASVDRER